MAKLSVNSNNTSHFGFGVLSHSSFPPNVLGQMNTHIRAYNLGRYPAVSIEWLSDAYDEADVRDPEAGAVKHRVSIHNRRCSCCRPAEEDMVCEHIVAAALLAGVSPWTLVPERYTLYEWRQPYDEIAATGGFLDVTDAESRALSPVLVEGERVRAPVIMPNRRGGQKRIRSAREKYMNAARRGRGGERSGGRGGGRSAERGRGRSGGRGGGGASVHLV